jgi:hypothetical protein
MGNLNSIFWRLSTMPIAQTSKMNENEKEKEKENGAMLHST